MNECARERERMRERERGEKNKEGGVEGEWGKRDIEKREVRVEGGKEMERTRARGVVLHSNNMQLQTSVS